MVGVACDFKYALAGVLAPHDLLSALILARHYFHKHARALAEAVAKALASEQPQE